MSAPLTIINPSERDYTRHRYVLSFGAYSCTHLMVYASSLEDALEECAEWLADHAPGHIMLKGNGGDTRDPELDVLMREACQEHGLDFDAIDWNELDGDEQQRLWDIEQEAYSDLTECERGYLTSYEWCITFEDPSRAEIKAFIASLAERHYSDGPVVAVNV